MTETVPLPTTEDLDVRPRRGWKPYPGYKESEVEWFTEIPAHWAVKRLKYASYINPESLPETTPADREFRYLDISNVDSNGHLVSSEPMVFRDAPTRARRIVRRGDTILSTVRTYLKAIAYIDTECDDLIVSTGFAVLRPRSSLDAAFQSYVVRSEPFVQAVMSHSEGVGYPAIAPSELGCLPIWLPSLPEQRAIAAFLDRETAKIDALVVRKQRLIDLLHEKRSALITRAVTKGLDPTVPMKENGILWLGEIPAHWEVRRLKFAAKLDSGHTPSRSVPEYWEDCTIPWVSLNDVGHLEDTLRVHDTANLISELGLQNSSARMLPEGTVILSRDATVGRAAILGRPMATSQHFVNWTCRPELMPEYLLRAFRGPMQQEFQRLVMGSTLSTIGMPDVNSFRVPLPPVREQEQIVSVVRKECGRIDALIAQIERAIDRLREYRIALISAAVTGKIDVRGEA